VLAATSPFRRACAHLCPRSRSSPTVLSVARRWSVHFSLPRFRPPYTAHSFAAFQADAWGRAGSRRFAADAWGGAYACENEVAAGDSPTGQSMCLSPLHPDTAFSRLGPLQVRVCVCANLSVCICSGQQLLGAGTSPLALLVPCARACSGRMCALERESARRSRGRARCADLARRR
jgi:hypothetical protein